MDYVFISVLYKIYTRSYRVGSAFLAAWQIVIVVVVPAQVIISIHPLSTAQGAVTL